MAKKKSKKSRAPAAEPPVDRAEAESAEAEAEADEKVEEESARAVAPRSGPKVEPKLHAQPAVGTDVVTETAKTALETLRENWQVIAAGLLVIVVVIVFVTWRIDATRARNRLAWEEFSNAQTAAGPKVPSPERLQELLDRYRGTTAEPFILLRLGDAYFAQGGREGAERAIEVYERVRREFGSNEVASHLATTSIEAARAALTFEPAKYAAAKDAKVEWAKGEGEGEGSRAKPATATGQPSEPPSK